METEQNLRSLQDQAATTNATLAKIDEAGEKLQNIGSSVENVGKKFLPVTAAVTGLGTVAVKTAADFDSEMSKVSAISGATGDDFDQLLSLIHIYIEVYTDYKDPDMEANIEEVLTGHGLYYEKSEVWIEAEKMYEVLYELTL